MAHYKEARVNTHLSKPNSSTKDNTGTTLCIKNKSFEGEELSHKITTRQKTKIRKAFPNNASTDINLVKTCLVKRWEIWCIL